MLDTHVLLWWLQDSPRLGQMARLLIADPDHQLMVSIASPLGDCGEAPDRQGGGKRRGGDGRDGRPGISLLDLHPAHMRVLEAMPPIHRDPFDHLIIAHALAEQCAVITDDAAFPPYGVRCIPA
ncbi:type II toxin-antitoxin system VapC family toxin [Blastomonas sp. SL216]|uniref:type II toxin-antitoxin system VapC family toxin n=1 Tax=Blastomonas sp. SL216 TaxID=2995169 RepID=UPI0023779D23|nr:type II toxin-antitoxin system VapC family toxin [Blastomonas sp. SL216]